MTAEEDIGEPRSPQRVGQEGAASTSPPTARAINILEFLAARPHRQFPLVEISRELGLNKATCLSILLELTSAGWLIRNGHTKLYSLGPALHALGSAADAAFPAVEYARLAIHELVKNKDATGVVVSKQQDQLVVLESVGTENHLNPRPRQRNVFRAPFGISFVAWGTPESRDDWLQAADHPPTDEERAWLNRAFDSMRRHRYGIDSLTSPMSQLRTALAGLADDPGTAHLHSEIRELSQRIGLCGQVLPDQLDTRDSWAVNVLYAPIFDETSLPVLNIALHPLRHEMPSKEIERWGYELVETANRITRQSGGTPPL